MGVATLYQELERLCRLDRPIPRRSTMSSPYQRADLPTVGAATRGSITGAMAAAHPDVCEEALRNLHRDQYANNTRNTRDSRWNLWTRLAQQWGLPPLPITTDLVNAIGASLKQGRYRSAPQVFSMARQQHVTLVKQPLSMDIELLIKQTLRSIERGLGPPTLKDAFTVEDLASITCHPHSGPTPPHWIDDTYDCTLATIVCCWWMLRGHRSGGGQTGTRLVRDYTIWQDGFRFPATKPTPSGCASPDLIHACVQTASRTYARTTPSSSTSSGLRRNEAAWAPRNPFFSPD